MEARPPCRSPRGGVEVAGRVVTKRIDRNRPAVTHARSRFAGATKHAFGVLAHTVISQVVLAVHARQQAMRKADGEEDIQSIVDKILNALDLSALESLAEDATTILATVIRDGVAEGLGQIDVGASVDIAQISDDAVEYARQRAAELVGMRWNDSGHLVENPNAEYAITDSTREMLRADVTRAIEDGTSTDDLAATLKENYAFSDARAETIARTEVARADVEGNLAAYRGSGVVVGKVWLLGSEHDEMDECDEAEAMGTVELDDDFGGIGDPPAHPNCVCDVAPVVGDDSGTDDTEE